MGRGDDPLLTATPVGADLGDSRAGNRFDSLTGAFRVLYFGTDLEACFGETLSRYRADPKLAFIDEEWETSRFMARGTVPKDWRMRRTAVRVVIKTDRRFLDVEALGTRKRLLRLLGPVLALFEVEDLDVATIRGPDRRVTRLIAEWAWRQVDERGDRVFAGLRYLSRVDTGWECWAVFDDVDIEELERHPILETTPELLTVAESYGLRVF